MRLSACDIGFRCDGNAEHQYILILLYENSLHVVSKTKLYGFFINAASKKTETKHKEAGHWVKIYLWMNTMESLCNVPKFVFSHLRFNFNYMKSIITLELHFAYLQILSV